MAAKKTSKKSSVPGRPFTAGDPRISRGSGPKKGAANAGRPPDEFKRRMQAMGSSDATLKLVACMLADPTHPDFARMLSMVWDRAYGKAAQSMDVTTNGETLTRFTLGIATA